MNKGLFRLVFSKHLGMYVPASEVARTHIHKSAGSRVRSRHRAMLALVASSMITLPVYAAQPGGLVPTPGTPWINASINSALTNANTMTITQAAQKAILNWDKFNINNGQILNIQDQSSWSALHIIHDLNPSVISGQINALGHEYLYNANGIIFGNGAQVNVGSLTASSLNITPDLFNAGVMTAAPGVANFSGNTGFVHVNQGATITTPSGGSVMLLAPEVTNSGVISTPDGQTILAAGQKVYLLDSTDPAGVLVEVDSGGTATNLGQIMAQRGNITMMGLAVNQQGTLKATTSVRANGSIFLKAQDTVIPGSYNPSTNTYSVARFGTVNVGANSVTQVSPELTDQERVIDAQAFSPSQITMVGHSVQVDGTIQANGGNVSITTLPDNVAFASNSLTGPQRVYLGSDALIDVSGVNATAPMSDNQLAIQLFSDQLKDAPLLRGGPLFGQTIYVDARKGTPLIDISAALAAQGKTVAQKLSTGGTVSIDSSPGNSQGDQPADVVIETGAKINVSGGSVTYLPGVIKESELLYNGKVIPISQASPNLPYSGIGNTYSVTDPKWGVTQTWTLTPSSSATLSSNSLYEQGYTDGKSAGIVNIKTPNTVLNGTFIGDTTSGVFQRSTPVNGGTLQLDLLNNVDIIQNVQTQALNIASGDILTDPQKSVSYLDTSLFQNGFNHLSVKTSGDVTVDAAMTLSPKGSVSLTAGNVQINNNISVASGQVTVSSAGNVVVADHVKITTAGLWTNDTPGVAGAQTALISTAAGNISMTGSNFQMGADSLLDASSGAWLNSKGQLTAGTAGNIALTGVTGPLNVQAYGFGHGGNLNIKSLQNIQVGGNAPSDPSIYWIDSAFFSQGGFSSYSVTSNGSTAGMASLVIGDPNGAATLIHPEMKTMQLSTSAVSQVSGTDITGVANQVLKFDYLRQPVSLAFSGRAAGADPLVGDLKELPNTIIQLDAPYSNTVQGSISLDAVNHLSVLGKLIAPAGNINLNLSSSDALNYDSTQSIFLGAESYLSASGFYAQGPTPKSGLLNAEVLNAGNITVSAAKGSVIQKEGSVLDVSGSSGLVDVNLGRGYVQQNANSAAGTIAISSRDGMVLDGTLIGKASGTAAAGSLNLSLTGADSTGGSGYVNTSDILGRQLIVTQNKILRGSSLQEGGAVDSTNGTAQISMSQIAQGGFDQVKLSSGLVGRSAYTGQDQIVLANGVDLKVPTSITLDAQEISLAGTSPVKVESAYVSLNSENPDSTSTNTIALTQGNASLQVNANWIDINGKLAINGVSKTTLNSQLDIRGRGNLAGTAYDANIGGWLETTGELDLTARQIYPVTNSIFKFETTGTGSLINVNSNGQASTGVLSAGGVLVLSANEIDQSGVLKAPLGQIELDAANRLVLATNSLTSVSADNQIIPYGETMTSGASWFASNNATLTPSQASQSPIAKKLTLNSADIEFKSGSKIDVSGGGDLLAYEWINGIGGSKDILSQPGVYAVLPSQKGGEYAPFDYAYQKTSNVTAGETIYLSGIPGLAAGYYALLPARYALLPGAYMIQTSAASVLPGKQVAQLDGSTLTSGYFSTASGNSKDTNWGSFIVTAGSVFHTPSSAISHAASQYLLSSGNNYFANLATNAGLTTPRLASDVGQVVFNAGQNLTLDGSLVTSNPDNARGAIVDITSGKITVVSSLGPDDGTLQLTSSSLNAMNADSLLLGGTRSQGNNGLVVNTSASDVTFANDTAHSLKLNELIATASDTLNVLANASISTSPNTKTAGSNAVTVNGDGALLAVSGANNFVYNRSGASTVPALGTLNINSGANIQAAQSLVIDSTETSSLQGNISVGSGGSATFGANRILLGNAGSQLGLLLDNTKLASLGSLSKLTLNSYNNIDLYGPLSFGNKALDITLNSGGLAGHMTSGDLATIAAQNLVIENATGSNYALSANASNSTLNINAKTVTFQGVDPNVVNAPSKAGQMGVSGFDTVNVNATGETLLSGNGQTSIQAANTNINSGRVTAATASDFTLQSSGNLNTAKISNPDVLPISGGFGGKATLIADTVNLGGDITLYSGKLTAHASTGDVNVLNGANISVASKKVDFSSYSAYAPGGSLTLQADLGNVLVASGSSIDVSGGAGGNAGSFNVLAVNGSANIAGSLNGQALSGLQSGSFKLDVSALPNFAQINTAVENGGFNASRDLRVRTGDVVLADGDTVTANNVLLTADSGNIAVNSNAKIDAHTGNGGSISLNAGQNITLLSGSLLDAHSTDSGAQGGTVKLATTQGSLDLQSGSAINVSAGQGGAGGQVMLRAPRINNNTDIAISELNSTFTGESSIQAEGFKTYTASNITTTSQAKSSAYYADAQSFMNSVLTGTGVGLNRLGKTWNDGVFHITPGIELDNSSNLTLANDWSLSTWRFDSKTGLGVTTSSLLASGLDANGQPLIAGELTLRASGNLAMNGSLSDGFLTAATTAAVQGLSSWGYRLVSGADLGSSNILATVKASAPGIGDLNLSSNKLIRTGTGNIDIATGGDLNMGNDASVIYTAGYKASSLAGFVLPLGGKANYLVDGGNISITAQGNIVGKVGSGLSSDPQQLINNWLFRQGGGSKNLGVSWWVRPDLFKEGVATFGGGNIDVVAGGDITDFSAAIPTTAQYLPDGSNHAIYGGGNLSVKAGGSLYSGVYFVGQGKASISAGDNISQAGDTFGTVIGLQDASVNISAGKNVYIETVFNPTLYDQSVANVTGTENNTTGLSAFFNTYSPNAAVNVSALIGGVTFGLSKPSVIEDNVVFSNTFLGSEGSSLGYYPPTLTATAFNSNISATNLTLMPSPVGNLSLLAANNISADSIVMSDAAASLLPNVSQPVFNLSGAHADAVINSGHAVINSGDTATSLHASDATPVVIVARDGSLQTLDQTSIDLTLPKQAYINAGHDIKSLQANIQNNNSSDITIVSAGNDFLNPTPGEGYIDLAGPGQLLVKAGRNIDLGSGAGITTIGNTQNNVLASAGASVTMLAGMGDKGANVAAYIATYISPAGSGPAVLSGDATQLADYRNATNLAVAAYMRELTGKQNLSLADAMSQFMALDINKQAIFAYRHFSSELLADGQTFATTANHNRGNEAIASMFGNGGYKGDLSMYQSQVATLEGGSIDILNPGGAINVGIPGVGGGNVGVITQRGGDIRAYSESGFQVNESKVITQYGGDITVWVNNGDIDAGRGSKTALSVPQRTVTTNTDGFTTVNFTGVATGSGIRAQTYDPDGPQGPGVAPPLGSVALLAPHGILNASEAGIAAGNFLAVATQVLGANNISISGTSSGVPAANTSSLGGSLGMSNVASDATKSASDDVSRQLAQSSVQDFSKKNFLPAFLSVEVIGLGDI